ncbi:MAG: aminotransferase class I/II-fold pyridoxal phosphate-dependent enzyme [Hyphomicrobium sp.]|nr:aminotransferase class I/II-fold pyridoxal phosphate-dependent enzyme [Hyphomicrobium sp.]
MPTSRLTPLLETKLDALRQSGRFKGADTVVRGVLPPRDGRGPRYLLEGYGDRPFLRMNSNSYLGLSLDRAVIAAEEEVVRLYGTGPGAVRFISGTWAPHVVLEARLAAFHGREAGMLFSSAYATVMGVLPPLITDKTIVISDALNHNCIINAISLARPAEKRIYQHLDLDELERHLAQAAKTSRRAIIVTDGVFSMRGDHAPLDEIMKLANAFDTLFPENVIVVADDSHGVGGFGETGRGTEEVSGGSRVDILVATLGKAFGVNGGYVVASDTIIGYLRETSPFYIYSNPITPGEAGAALAAVELVDSPHGRQRLDHLRAMTARFREGLARMWLETVAGQHPVVPLMVRDTDRTARLVAHLQANGILATGLGYPIVPKGDDEIRFQMCADHTPADIDEALSALEQFSG